MGPDSMLALQAATFQVSTRPIGNAATAAAYLWHRAPAPVTGQHTKAHVGHPWNELADSLA
eukprot:3543330-Lingulodinium_polyedra.AAC.1